MELPGTHALEKEYDQAVAFETHRKNVNDAKMRAVHQVRLALCWVFLCLCNYKKKGVSPPSHRVHACTCTRARTRNTRTQRTRTAQVILAAAGRSLAGPLRTGRSSTQKVPTYDEFEQMVKGADLKPLDKTDKGKTTLLEGLRPKV